MRVLDISQQLPGPYTSALLADLGAAVTKVEPPAGDPSRRLDPQMYSMVNAGKSTVTLDLKDPSGVEELHRLVERCDVFIEGFRPGVAARLGASWEVLSALNPALVYCSISACGQQGPYANVPMHDLNLQAMAGIDPGQGIGVPWVDLGTATSCALAIVAAWHQARQSGIGRYLDAAMLDTAVLWGRVKASALERVEPTYGTFRTADGTRVAVAILEDHIWPRLCQALGWRDWYEAQELKSYDERVRRGEEIQSRLAAACEALSQDELLVLAAVYDLPVTALGASLGTDAHAQMGERRLAAIDGRRLPLPPRITERKILPLDNSVD
jgi:crotonobetainyl-CoA:carnitine CoA-transferase CaiB-like acyl-CoA transferase